MADYRLRFWGQKRHGLLGYENKLNKREKVKNSRFYK